MSEQSTFDGMPSEQVEIWKRATASDYIKFDDKGTAIDILFVDGLVKTAPGIGGKESYEFIVIQTIDGEKVSKILGTQSKGLMDGLLAFYPLAERRFGITRRGERFETKYTVVEL